MHLSGGLHANAIFVVKSEHTELLIDQSATRRAALLHQVRAEDVSEAGARDRLREKRQQFASGFDDAMEACGEMRESAGNAMNHAIDAGQNAVEDGIESGREYAQEKWDEVQEDLAELAINVGTKIANALGIDTGILEQLNNLFNCLDDIADNDANVTDDEADSGMLDFPMWCAP